MVADSKKSYTQLNYTQRGPKGAISVLTVHGQVKICSMTSTYNCSSLSAMFDEINLVREEMSIDRCTADILAEKCFIEATDPILLQPTYIHI